MTRRNTTQLAISSLNRLCQKAPSTSVKCTAPALFSTAAPASSSSSSSSSNYKSPYADYFATMKDNKCDFSGKTPPGGEIIPETAMLKCGIPESVLKFKTTSYSRLMLPPYVQHGEYKVTLQTNLRDLPIETPLEKEIFQQIVGTRFDPERNLLKLTSNHFASRIENKRHLCSMLDRIVIGAKRLAAEISSKA